MEVSYNLKYQKNNFSGKKITDKEGEIIVYSKGFRLKGKGAGDKGELINFSEIKEFFAKDEKVMFSTFNKDRYTLSNAGTLYEQLLIDLYKSRNEFLRDALFMKEGGVISEYEGHFQRVSKSGKVISKDSGKVSLYKGSLVITAAQRDAFDVDFNFVKSYEFDEMEYSMKMVMEDGNMLFLSQFGNDFEFFKEKFEMVLSQMYQEIVNEGLKNLFPHYHAATLLRLAYMLKGGKAVSLKELAKIDKDLAEDVKGFVFKDEDFKEKMSYLMEMASEEEVFFGLAKDDNVKDGFVKWMMVALPQNNLVAFSILPRWESKEGEGFRHNTYFYKIIMEKGSALDKVEDKLLEINQALTRLNFVKDPCYKDKRELVHSPYQYAIRKLPFLRLLRKSYLGRVGQLKVEMWHKKAEALLEKAKVV